MPPVSDALSRVRDRNSSFKKASEEFLPHLFYRGLSLRDGIFELGPRQTFAGLSFASSLAGPGSAGHPRLRTKNQDFILGKRLYMMLSFDENFRDAERVDSYLGYVCAECKINLDKTMFQEAVATSRDLKTTVPSFSLFHRMRISGYDAGFSHNDAHRRCSNRQKGEADVGKPSSGVPDGRRETSPQRRVRSFPEIVGVLCGRISAHDRQSSTRPRYGGSENARRAESRVFLIT